MMRTTPSTISALAGALAGTLAALALAAPASAAVVTTETVMIGGETKAAIAVYGELEDGDEVRFSAVADHSDAAVVKFHSPGGDLIAGLAIGNLILAKGYATLVVKGDECASACALAWLAGQPRYMAVGAKVGFHAAYTEDGETMETDAPANALVGAYAGKLGLSSSAIIYVTQANPDDMQWLSFRDADDTGIDVTRLNARGAIEPMPGSGKAASNGFALGTSGPPDGDSEALSGEGLSDRALAAARSYFDGTALENSAAITFLHQSLARDVRYFGETTTRDKVMADKIAFVGRWPERKYVIRPGSLEADCSEDGECSVAGVYAWWAYSAARDSTSAGTAKFHLVFSDLSPLTVLLEESDVLARKVVDGRDEGLKAE